MGLTERSFLERMELMGFTTTRAITNADRIISGEEVPKRISTGEWDAVKNIYAIYLLAGNVNITPIVNRPLGAIIHEYNDPKIIFIEITKEE